MEENVDPYRRLVQELNFKHRVPDGTSPELLLKLQKQHSEYELVTDESGVMWFQTIQSRRIEICKILLPYNHPQLKSTENKVESDLRVHVTVKQFEIAAPQVVVESAVRAAIPEVVEAKLEEEETRNA